MHCAQLSLQGREPEFLHWNTKFVECPSAKKARIGCELSPARRGQQQESTEGLPRVRKGSHSLRKGRMVKLRQATPLAAF
jgi:hypothetical protein